MESIHNLDSSSDGLLDEWLSSLTFWMSLDGNSGDTASQQRPHIDTLVWCRHFQFTLHSRFSIMHKQGGHGTGKTGNLAVNFSRQGKHREFSKFNFLHRENCGNTGKILKIENFLKILLLKWQQCDRAFLS